MSETWISWATKRPGPPNKVFPGTNKMEGIVLHSMEGWLLGSLGELDNPNRQASWCFSLSKEGSLYQHYPLESCCWASGNETANESYLSIELEGTAAIPINDAQLATILKLLNELGFSQHGVDIFMHREVATKWEPNVGPTACPSERYSRLFTELEKPQMDEAQVRDIIESVIADKLNTSSLVDSTTVLVLVSQILGVTTSTYSDPQTQALVSAIRAKVFPTGH
jgi:hypothetical protein